MRLRWRHGRNQALSLYRRFESKSTKTFYAPSMAFTKHPTDFSKPSSSTSPKPTTYIHIHLSTTTPPHLHLTSTLPSQYLPATISHANTAPLPAIPSSSTSTVIFATPPSHANLPAHTSPHRVAAYALLAVTRSCHAPSYPTRHPARCSKRNRFIDVWCSNVPV